MSELATVLKNAVAPDWNLKCRQIQFCGLLQSNAVAPDWNLKLITTRYSVLEYENAVAPDWNLKIQKRHTK